MLGLVVFVLMLMMLELGVYLDAGAGGVDVGCIGNGVGSAGVDVDGVVVDLDVGIDAGADLLSPLADIYKKLLVCQF